MAGVRSRGFRRALISLYVTSCVATGAGAAVWGALQWGTICFDNVYFFAYGTFIWHAVCIFTTAYYYAYIAVLSALFKRKDGSSDEACGISMAPLLFIAVLSVYIGLTGFYISEPGYKSIIILGFAALVLLSPFALWVAERYTWLLTGVPGKTTAALSFGLPLVFFLTYTVAKDIPGYFGDTPTVTLVVVDTLRSDHLGLYGYRRNTSPNIDAYGEGGTVFTKAISQAPWTSPSVATLFTSTVPTVHTVTSIRSALPANAVTLAELLGSEGYATVCVSGNPHVSGSLVQGFDYFSGVTTYSEIDPVVCSYFGESYGSLLRRALTVLGRKRAVDDADLVTSVAISAAGKYRRRPLFLYVHYMDPHSPYDAPELWSACFGPPITEERPAISPARTVAEKLKSRDYIPPITEEQVEEFIRRYDCEIRFCDEYVGNLLDWVERNRTARRLTVITADHGEQFFDHTGYLHHGGSVYRELLEVPFILRCSDLETIPQVDVQIGLIDVLPTITDWAGINPGSDISRLFEGRSLLPLTQGPNGELNRFIVAENARDLPKGLLGNSLSESDHFDHKSIQNEDYKLIIDYRWGVEELYNIKTDRTEQSDIVIEYPEVAGELRSELENLFGEAESRSLDSAEERMSSEHLERLKDLGYVR